MSITLNNYLTYLHEDFMMSVEINSLRKIFNSIDPKSLKDATKKGMMNLRQDPIKNKIHRYLQSPTKSYKQNILDSRKLFSSISIEKSYLLASIKFMYTNLNSNTNSEKPFFGIVMNKLQACSNMIYAVLKSKNTEGNLKSRNAAVKLARRTSEMEKEINTEVADNGSDKFRGFGGELKYYLKFSIIISIIGAFVRIFQYDLDIVEDFDVIARMFLMSACIALILNGFVGFVYRLFS